MISELNKEPYLESQRNLERFQALLSSSSEYFRIL